MSRLTRHGTPEPVSRDHILRRERGQGNVHFSCLDDHEQDWQPHPVDPHSCYMCDYTYIHMEGGWLLQVKFYLYILFVTQLPSWSDGL